MEAHFTAKSKGGSANLKVAGGFENQYCFRFFFSGGIDQGLGSFYGACGKREAVNFLLGSGGERGFGRSKEVLSCLSGEKRGERTGKCEGEKRAVERSGAQTMRI